MQTVCEKELFYAFNEKAGNGASAAPALPVMPAHEIRLANRLMFGGLALSALMLAGIHVFLGF